jgi:hypothetical protein
VAKGNENPADTTSRLASSGLPHIEIIRPVTVRLKASS